MTPKTRTLTLTVITVLVSLAFAAAGLAKLAGASMMVQTFDAVGLGQWFRYVTGIIELGGAILLWLPGRRLIGAALLTVTMAGAILAHLFILGTATMAPAVVLGLLSAILAYTHSDEMAATPA